MRFTTLSLTTVLLAISTMAAPADHFLSVRDDPCQADSKAHCCDTVANTTDTSIAGTLAKLNITPGQAKGPVGLTCTPITTLGEILNLGTRCNSNAVCCSNNTYTGLINFGCTPMNINIL